MDLVKSPEAEGLALVYTALSTVDYFARYTTVHNRLCGLLSFAFTVACFHRSGMEKYYTSEDACMKLVNYECLWIQISVAQVDGHRIFVFSRHVGEDWARSPLSTCSVNSLSRSTMCWSCLGTPSTTNRVQLLWSFQ